MDFSIFQLFGPILGGFLNPRNSRPIFHESWVHFNLKKSPNLPEKKNPSIIFLDNNEDIQIFHPSLTEKYKKEQKVLVINKKRMILSGKYFLFRDS
jgi:hypothetical protein